MCAEFHNSLKKFSPSQLHACQYFCFSQECYQHMPLYLSQSIFIENPIHQSVESCSSIL